MWTSLDSIPTRLLATALVLQQSVRALVPQPRFARSPAAQQYRRASVPYINPQTVGGSQLTINDDATLGEPLNVILSAESDSAVLQPSLDNGGYLNYMLSTYLAAECLHEHYGGYQMANLGQGNATQQEELRWDFGDQYIGSCQETFQGGLHSRYWIQNSTGAYFMAVSLEEDLANFHDIPTNGYDIGRDYLIGNLTGGTVDTQTVTNQTTVEGNSTFNNYTYHTNVQYVSGLLNYSNDDINHYDTVSVNGRATDGLVAVLTVKIVSQPKSGAGFHAIAFASPISLLVTAVVAGWTLTM